jgi:MFS family permease
MGGYLNLGFLTNDVKITWKKFTAVATLISGTVAFFFLFPIYQASIFRELTTDNFYVYATQIVFYGSSAVSAVAGSLLSDKINRRKLLWTWITFGVAGTASLFALQSFPGIDFAFFSSIILGISLGFGFPSVAALLADHTFVEERARVSGAVILVTFVMMFTAYASITFLQLGTVGIILALVILRSTSFVALLLDKCERETGKKRTWRKILKNRNFAYYLFPWIMFTIASNLAWWVIPTAQFDSIITMGHYIRYACLAVFGFCAGIGADRFGRKQPVIIGLVMLGVSFAFLSITISSLTVLAFMVVSGVAWGMLFNAYLAIPGDLALPGSKEKFYLIGTFTPLIIMGLTIKPDSLPISGLSSLLSVILFVSIIPILQAKETLPEDKMSSRGLREYLAKVSKRSAEPEENDA